MSGIEIAGLAFGVLPILVEVVKSYSAVAKKVHTLRHYSREVRSISEQLKVHKGIFLNEVRLILRSVRKEEEVESMLDDTADPHWTSKLLDEKLSTVLSESFDVCHCVIEEIKSTIESMREEMAEFDDLLAQRSKDESLKSTLKRLRGSIRITFNKSRHDRCLARLRERNGDLCALRSQISAFQRYDTQKSRVHSHLRTLPTDIEAVKIASSKLHEALCNVWCCDDPDHRGHYAKLCIDAEVQAEVRLDLAISCHEPFRTEKKIGSSASSIWLYVQSTSMSPGLSAKAAVSDSLTNHLTLSYPLESLTSHAVNVLKQKASSDLLQQSPCRKKVKRVHFDDRAMAIDTSLSIQASPAQVSTPQRNLCREKNICEYLQRHYRNFGQKPTECCIGYLETPQMYKHLFYFREEAMVSARGLANRNFDSTYSVFDVMQCDADVAIKVEDQLRLAHKIALALLRFNDTTWLPERWRLRDLSYFGSADALDDAALKTLHLSSQISAPAVCPAGSHMMHGLEQTADTVSDQVRYGINNTTLFFLGVALLEIAHWKPIEEKMTPRDLNNEVFAARRLAAGRALLGPLYQKIVEKCLQCNFGFGTKLSNKNLQTAVYNDVVCGLEDMIKQLEI